MANLRRLRATTVIAVLWGAAWAAGGFALASWRVFLGHPRLATPLVYWPRFALTGTVLLGLCGLVAGGLFAVSLRRFGTADVDSLPMARTVRWGAIAGAATIVVLPLVGLTAALPLVAATVITAGIGATSALLTVSAARRARAVAFTPPTESLLR